MRDFLLAFFQESTHKPLLVGIVIGLFSYLLIEVKAGKAKPIYLGMCCVLGSTIGYFITPMIATPAGKLLGLQDLGNEALQTLLAGYLSFENLGIVTRAVKMINKKLKVNEKSN